MFSTPTLQIDGEVKCVGQIPSENRPSSLAL